MNLMVSPTKSLLSLRERTELVYRLKLKREVDYRLAKKSPRAFRNGLEICLAEGSACCRFFGDDVQDWQAADFSALDSAWQRLAGSGVPAGYQRAYIERPRGHSKTSDIAVQIAWVLEHASVGVHGIAAAADREQGALILEAIRRVVRQNPSACRSLVFRQNKVINALTGSCLEIISSDVQSSWGALPDFVICDELCHWEKPGLWYSLLSSAAKRPDCLLVVLTNAGVGRGWHWDVRESARESSDWYFSSLDGSCAPWISEKNLDEQRALLPRPVFERLWKNLWQHSDGEFVTIGEAEGCRLESLVPREFGEPGVRYIAAIDYAEKHDYTVGVILHREGDVLIVDRMDVVVPSVDSPVPISWVEDWMRRVGVDFPGVTFVVDEYQLLGTIQKLSSSFDIRRFEFAGGKGNHALAMVLRQLIVHRGVRWFPDCGAIELLGGAGGGGGGVARDDLETELASLLLRQSVSGTCRITHRSDGRHHDDRSFALGAACLALVREGDSFGGSSDWMDVTSPESVSGTVWGFLGGGS